MAQIFVKNLDIIFFIYGLAFVAMGIAIFIQPRKESAFKLSGIIWLLGLFALTHGFNEWLDMFAIIKGTNQALDLARFTLLFLSYVFLFEFGRRFICLKHKNFLDKWVTYLFLGITAVFVFTVKEQPSVWPRYFLAFPGGMFAAIGFILYYRDNKTTFEPIKVRKYFSAAAFSVGLYAVFGGLVTPKASFFPASVVNNESFLRVFGVPVQLYRALFSVMLAWSVSNILGIFNWEIRERLESSLNEMTTAKAYCDNIFYSIVHSLFVIDNEARVKTVNSSAVELSGHKYEELIGKEFTSLFEEKGLPEILEEMDTAAFLLSPDFRIINANSIFLKISGMKKESVIGQHCYKLTHGLTHPCQPPEDTCPIIKLARGGEYGVQLHKHTDSKGAQYLVNVTAAPIRDSSGKIICYLHLSKDVENIQDSDRLIRQDKESVKLLIGKLEACVRALQMREYFSEKNFDKLLEMGKFKGLEMYYKAKSGNIPVNISGALMKNKEGAFMGIVLAAEDISELKRLMQKEKEVTAARAAAEVEHKRAQEIGRLYNELKATQFQLIQAEKMHVVGRLAAGVAHEVKNPLAIIIQGIEYLKQKVASCDENAPTILKYIEEAVARADNIIRGILDFSALSKLDIKPNDLNSVIERTLLLVGHEAEKNSVKVIKGLAEGLPQINIDRNKIEQVFVNLILNAIQAMPQGGKLSVSTGLENKDGQNWVVAQVEDTGKGIPKETLAMIFDPFFTTKRDMGGTGLGLSIVRNIVEMHSGKIEIKNKEDGSGVMALISFKAK